MNEAIIGDDIRFCHHGIIEEYGTINYGHSDGLVVGRQEGLAIHQEVRIQRHRDRVEQERGRQIRNVSFGVRTPRLKERSIRRAKTCDVIYVIKYGRETGAVERRVKGGETVPADSLGAGVR